MERTIVLSDTEADYLHELLLGPYFETTDEQSQLIQSTVSKLEAARAATTIDPKINLAAGNVDA